MEPGSFRLYPAGRSISVLCDNGALAQVAQMLRSLLGDLQKPPGRGPGYSVLGDSAGAGLDGPSGPCPPQPFCHSAKIRAFTLKHCLFSFSN